MGGGGRPLLRPNPRRVTAARPDPLGTLGLGLPQALVSEIFESATDIIAKKQIAFLLARNQLHLPQYAAMPQPIDALRPPALRRMRCCILLFTAAH